MKPESLEKLIVSINALPGITKKQAEKLSYNLLTKYKDDANIFVETFKKASMEITQCEECGNLAEDKLCNICADPSKDRRRILIIVESPLDVFKFEDSEVINGYYHVLHGLINVEDNDFYNKINIKTLKERSEKFKEVILALSPNMEGIVTANFLKSLLNNKKVTQLAQGIPLGAAMEYVDKFTLEQALKNRKELK